MKPITREGSFFSAVAVIGSIIAIAILLACGKAEANEIAIYTIMGEAAGEPLEAQVAVAEVIRNRAKLRNQSVEAVCLAPRQFSFWNNRKKAEAWLEKYGTGEAYQRASRAWCESEESDLTMGADLYFNPMLCKPRWNMDMVLPRRQFGKHVFMKEVMS